MRQSAGSSELSGGGDQTKAGMGNRKARPRNKPRSVVCWVRLIARAPYIR
jgi:hypothetical protein